MSTANLIRPGGGSRPGRLLALLSATAVAVSLLSAPSSPAAASTGPAASTPPDLAGLLPADAEPTAVTLITGDTVLWRDTGNGSPRVEVEEAPRDYPVTFDQSGTPDDFYVIPTDAMPHVVDGTLDRELFNIPGLIRQGLDDATTDDLPVIVTFDQQQSKQQLNWDADALPATSKPTALTHLNGVGVTVNRGNAGAFRNAVIGEPRSKRSNRTASARGLDGAVEQVLLDQMLKVDLAESVPQIGAPQAWDAGYTGEGVAVAVLDTGVDVTHPDLAGQVMAAANFTDEPDATDTHGHGSHVASTIAGTGAASNGARTGVAPGADLLSGKVCNSNGDCRTSWIMAGMEWASAQGADVVNMSLGSDSPSDGTDPLSQLVNRLSADTGALFVTSAGNNGPGSRRVGSPAAADAALAVGAVDKHDGLARFSSRGPRLGDHAVKPEITAPGVDIVAARAAGTSLGEPVDDQYTSSDGTSMASPHVAGAAALLSQAQGLTGLQLKDALASTARDSGHRWYQQGTGRVDIPAALDSPIHATGTVDLGGIDGQAEQDIVYTNHTNGDITLTLQVVVTDLDGQSTTGLTLSTDALTVPAHGEASVTATAALDSSELTGQEAFGGVITAIGPNVALRTGIGFGPPLHRVEFEVLDSNGNRIGSDTADDTPVSLTHDTLDRNVGGPQVYHFGTSEGIAIGHIPAGKYTIIAKVLEHEPDAPGEFTQVSFLVEVEVDLPADTPIVLDARRAMLIEQPEVPRKAEKRNHAAAVTRKLAGADGASFTRADLGGSWPMYATPTPPGKLSPVSLFVTWTLAEPQPLHPLSWDQRCPRVSYTCYSETPAYVYNLPILYENGIPDSLHERITRAELVEVPTRFHSDHPDALIRQKFGSLHPLNEAITITRMFWMWFSPGTVTEYFLADDRFNWLREARIERRPEGGHAQSFTLWSDDRFPAVEAGARRGEERWHAAPMRMGVWDVREEAVQTPSVVERWAAASRNGPSGEWFAVPFDVMGNTRGHGGGPTNAASWRMWNTDTGTELEQTGVVFPLAPGEAKYRLEQVEEYPASAPFRTGRATTAWTFTSRPSDASVPPHYQCWIQQQPRQDVCQIQPLIRLEYGLRLDIHNRAPAGRARRFTIAAGHHSRAIDRAEVTELTVEASFDDGATWQDARVVGKPRNTRDTGGFLPSVGPYQEFRVVLMTPPLHRTNGFVALHVQATDANGGTVDQTIQRAFLLK